MKKYSILFVLGINAMLMTGVTWASVQGISCPSGISSGCNSCFQETQALYTCNPSHTTCARDIISSMSDVATNTGNTNVVIYDNDEGHVNYQPLQTSFVTWSQSQTNILDMFQFPAAYEAGRQNFTVGPSVAWYPPNSAYIGYRLIPGASVRWIEWKSGQWVRPNGVTQGASRSTPAFRAELTPRLYTSASTYIDHKQCVFYNVRFCGDGVIDSDKGEQCDDGNMNSGDGCSNICQTETATPVCTGLTVSPTTLTNGGMITYTCTGTNVSSYSIIAKNPSGAIIASATSAVGSLTLPATPAGTYNVECYVNNQVSTPDICKKPVTNTTVEQPVCTGLSVTPTSLTDGGLVNYTCTGSNVTSYSVAFTKPDGTALQTFSTATGSITIPATPTGTYTARCYVNGQGYALSECTKTITNNGTTVTPQILIDKRDANPADLDGIIGGNDSQTVSTGNAAVFKIRVTNTGTEDLKNIVLSDSIAPNCGGNVTLPSSIPGTWSGFLMGGSGNHTDTLLQPNEYFEYTCDKSNTTSNYTNTARVDAQGNISNIPVTSNDPTPVLIQNITNTTCNNLTLSTSGNTVYYACSGSGNVTNYTINLNGSQISTSATGSTTVGNGTHTFICYVNNNITSQNCQKSITINPEVTYPRIEVVKDDNDNRDDQQQIQSGGLAQFSIIVRNPGPEPLDNITLSDQFAPECNRNASETVNMILGAGNRDGRLDPGESFSYVCNRPGADQNTFPNNENRVCTSGRGTTSGNTVNACDTTRIYFGGNNPTCENIQIAQNGNQVNVTCSPYGGYRMFLMQNGQVINTLQNPNGQFTFGGNPGTYTVVCLRDGDRTVQPNCQRNITIRENRPEGVCTLQSSNQYGGAPLYTNLSCRSSTGSQQCMIKVNKNGQLWKTLYDCDSALTLPERGTYDATCYLGDGGENGCNTTIQVDVMTEIKTGPFLPILIITAIGMGAFITYRRRKTV